MSNVDEQQNKPELTRRRKTLVVRLIVLFMIFILFDIFFVYFTLFRDRSIDDGELFEQKGSSTEQSDDELPNSEEDLTPQSDPENSPSNDPTINMYTYPFEPAVPDAIFFEKLEIIGSQPAYISGPIAINVDTPPPIVIYSHGSNTTVATTMDSEFMLDLREYSEVLTAEGYIFAASNQHGANWGSAEAIQDMLELIEYIEGNYYTNGSIYLIGYSMGGLPTLNFAFDNPEKIVKIALLAPTSYASNYNEADFDALRGIPIKIWHGDADVNVPISLTYDLIERGRLFDHEFELEVLEGLGHWDVDTELISNIKEFFRDE